MGWVAHEPVVEQLVVSESSVVCAVLRIGSVEDVVGVAFVLGISAIAAAARIVASASAVVVVVVSVAAAVVAVSAVVFAVVAIVVALPVV